MPKQSTDVYEPHQGELFTHLRDSIRSRVAERISHSLLFDPDEYLSMHGDLLKSSVDPYEHYVSWGVFEKRRGITERSIARILGDIEIDYSSEASNYIKEFDASQLQTAKHADLVSRRNFAVYVHSSANYYRHPVAMALAHALRSAGASCSIASERDEPPDESTIPIVIAPHEFFGSDLPVFFAQSDFLTNSVLLNTEQALSPSMISSLPWLYSARGIFDLGFQTSQIWRRGGIPSTHVLPPFDATLRNQALAEFDRSHPLVNWISPDLLESVSAIEPIENRPLDIFFAGYATRLRSQFLLRNAAYLAEKKCYFAYADVVPEAMQPLERVTRKLFATNLALSLLTKCALNINRFSLGYFQWERNIVLGLSCGTPVVTTPCLRTPFFVPNVHYFEARTEHLGILIRWLLDSVDGIARAKTASHDGHKIMECQLTPERVGRHLLSFLADLPA